MSKSTSYPAASPDPKPLEFPKDLEVAKAATPAAGPVQPPTPAPHSPHIYVDQQTGEFTIDYGVYVHKLDGRGAALAFAAKIKGKALMM